MSERRRTIGTVFMSFGGFIMLLEIVGILTGTLGGPEILYFLGGVLEGVGMVFVLAGFLIKEDYVKNKEMM
jgi:hypothetical protein